MKDYCQETAKKRTMSIYFST